MNNESGSRCTLDVLRNLEYVASAVKTTIVYSYDSNNNNNFNSSNRENRRIVHFEKDNTLLRTRLLLRSYLYYLFSCSYVNHSTSFYNLLVLLKTVRKAISEDLSQIANRSIIYYYEILLRFLR